MTEKQYDVILSALADKLAEKDTTIACQKWEIENLKKKLAEAEYHLNPNGEKPKKIEIR